MQTSQTTYAKIRDGEDIAIIPEKKYEKLSKEAEKEGNEAPELLAIQTFTVYEPQETTEFSTLVPLPEEQVNIFNRGLVLKQQGALRRLLQDENFEPVDGSYDLATICAEKMERKAVDPRQKALKLLQALTEEDLQAVMLELDKAN